ncbi:MAG: hypothetical protein P1Q69_06925 [Candidatus Thorarchaeota archaeon]|nr:hypothetical protein [Candidatus Thorarchaeota archaeon]
MKKESDERMPLYDDNEPPVMPDNDKDEMGSFIRTYARTYRGDSV